MGKKTLLQKMQALRNRGKGGKYFSEYKTDRDKYIKESVRRAEGKPPKKY